MSEWIFRKPSPAEKQREAVQGEFFANESIESEAQALVREGIQNSLDAALDLPGGKKEKVRVRIKVSGVKDALKWNVVAPYFEGAWDHFESDGSGLRNCPGKGSNCSFLVFEDFGTKGLCGDTTAFMRPKKNSDNPFYYYMRAEGQSSKSGNDRGRWGIGKFVFPRASQIRSFIALSRRLDDLETVVAGQCILKWHQVKDDYFSPDGWFGVRGQDDFGLPILDAEAIKSIAKLFGVTRTDQTGLSLVVPWIHPGMDETSFKKAVVKDFYYPILRNKLEVVIEGPAGETTISELSFDEVIKDLDAENQLDADIKGTIMLAREAAGRRGLTGFLLQARKDKKPIWSDDMLSEERKASINRELKNSKIVSVEIPVWVRRNGEKEALSNIQIWLHRDKTATGGRPVYIRDGLVIPGVRASLARGYRSLVLIEDRPMANLLGDAENPSHTQWDAKSENFIGNYVYGGESITFVRGSVKKLIDLLAEEDEEPDILALSDIFPDPTPDDGGKDPRPRPDTGDDGTPLPPIPPMPPAKTRTGKIKGGFVIAGYKDRALKRSTLTMTCGYDRAKGSAIKRWKPEDFELNKDPISIHVTGDDALGKTLMTNGNELQIDVNGSDFRIEVTGFDDKRDLFVSKVGLQEIPDVTI